MTTSRNVPARRKKRRERVVLRLYVAGATRAAGLAVELVRAFCEQYLDDRYDLDVVDIYQQPAVARAAQIVATPTLIRVRPEPIRRFIGQLSSPDKLASSLDL